jgi:hypothetical protein
MDMSKHRHGRRWLAGMVALAAVLALSLTVAGGLTRPASARNVVNVTFRVPADVQVNPCTPGDVINLHGVIHVVITTTSDGQGGYHVMNHLNSHLVGRSITTGTRYTSSDTKDDEWNARPPFSVVHTTTYDFELISQSGGDNYVLHMTMHQTVTANGVPTAVVDRFWVDCKG